jgi:hypothetical protein
MQDMLERHDREIAENRHGLTGTKQVFDIRFGQVMESIEELKSILKWAGGLIVTLMISFMSWSALQQYNANETQKADLQQQIKMIESQDQAAKDRERLIKDLREDLGTGGTITSNTASGGG